MASPQRETAAPNASRDGGRKTEATKHQRVSGYQSADEGASPLDRPLGITIFDDPHARTKTDTVKTLRELARLIPKRTAASKAELRLLKLAEHGDIRTTKKSFRHNANVIAINGVEGDYDGERMSIDEAAKRLRKAGVAALLYTSPSHRPDAPRWRVLSPTSRPLPPAKREQLMARVNGVLGGELARESFTLSQPYFYGRVAGQPAPIVELVEGLAIDFADSLDAGALDKHGKPWGVPDDPDSDDDEMPTEPDVERIKRELARIPASAMNSYHDWLKIGQGLHHGTRGSAEGMALWDEASQRCDGYDADELADKWESFGRYTGPPVTIGTIYHLAKQYAPKPSTFGELTFHTPAECALAPPRGYVVKGLLAPGDIASIFGAPGAGKSLIAPHVGYMVALGETAFGMRTKPGVVFYVAAEDATGLRQRTRALMLRRGDAPDFRVVGGVSDLFAEDAADLDALAEAVAQHRPVLIVIDTLAMAFPGLEENDAKSMGRVVAVARQLADHGAAVVLVHHDTKAEGSTPRGHSILNGALDMALHVRRDDDGVVRGRLTKNRNGTPDRDIAFRIGVEELDEDEDGDIITGAVAEELTGSAAARPKKLPVSQRAALAVLEEMEGAGVVSNTAWRDACADGFQVSQADERKDRKDAFSRARRALAQGGLIAFDASGNVHTLKEGDDE